MTFFDQLKHLFNQELYSNVATLASLALSADSDHSTDLLTHQEKFETYVYYADSLYHMAQHRKAEAVYRRALQMKKTVLKNKTSLKPNDNQKEQTVDVEIKYKMYMCLIKIKQSAQAISVLQTIPAKQRTAKVNLALARLYQQGGLERSAVTAYKEVLRECPLAFEATEGLLALGVKGNEVSSITLEAISSLEGCDWLNTLIKAHAHIHSREYSQAISTLKTFEAHPSMRSNANVILPLGECYYFLGDSKNALSTLQRARNIDPYMTRGLDIMAALLHRTNKVRELEELVSPSLLLSEYSTEVWTALAYQLYLAKKYSRAVYYAQKACFMNNKSVEALLLKGSILLDLKKYQESAMHFREALKIAPYRFEAHKGIVDCYVAWNRLREAVTAASNACKQLGQTPRPLTLYASVLMKDLSTICKAKSLLEKVLTQDECYLPAVLLLVDIYEQQNRHYSAIQMLQMQLTLQPSAKLYQVLGDLLARPGITHDMNGALTSYTKALNLEPQNRRALEGISRLDQRDSETSYEHLMANNEDAGPADSDTTYYLGSDPQAVSDASNGGHESETEAVWSDMELEFNAQT